MTDKTNDIIIARVALGFASGRVEGIGIVEIKLQEEVANLFLAHKDKEALSLRTLLEDVISMKKFHGDEVKRCVMSLSVLEEKVGK